MPKLPEPREVIINHIQVLFDGAALAVISTNQQVLLRAEVPEDPAPLQCLNNAQLTYLFGAFLIYSFTVPLDAAIGYLSLLNMK